MWRLRIVLHENAATINMPACTPSDSGDLTAVNRAFISPACGYKCELMQVAAVKLANDFASGGSLETNVLQLNATPSTHFEYQVICEEGKCVAKQSRCRKTNHSAAAATSITQWNLNSKREALPYGRQIRLQTSPVLLGKQDTWRRRDSQPSLRDLCCNLLFADVHECT